MASEDWGNIALLIDFENFGNLDDLSTLLDRLSKSGKVVVRRAFADWSSPTKSAQQKVAALGIDLVHQVRYLKGKNSSDMRLVIDAMDLLYEKNTGLAHIDTIAIASYDLDFVPLLVYLRSRGKRVVASGSAERISSAIANNCDEFVAVGEIKKPSSSSQPVDASGVDKTPKAKKNPKAKTKTDTKPQTNVSAKASTNGKVATNAKPKNKAKANSNGKATSKAEIDKAKSLVLRAMKETIGSDGTVNSSKLLQKMRSLEPGFRVKRLGYSKFSLFLNRISEVRVDKPLKGDVTVRLSRGQNGN